MLKVGEELLLQGNEACVEGALVAGCRFYAGYPITPSSEIAEILSQKLPQMGGTFIQMEDEIASMGAIIGASLAGVKSMTATSGPGFSLMQENIGFAAITEIPCVVINVMRGGPSTGLPTSPSQGDVMQARWGTHGDHPIIVLAPSSVKECFEYTIKAFNLSEKYRTPVILLSDEVIGHMREKIRLPDPDTVEIIGRVKPSVPPEWYIPYEGKSTDVPPMANFGEGYRYHVTGLIHDMKGFPTSNTDEVRSLLERLHRKIEKNIWDMLYFEEYLTEDAELLVIAYGSIARSAKRAVLDARSKGYKVGFLKLITLWPFMEDIVLERVEKVRTVLMPEMNTGQLIREVQRLVHDQKKVRGINKIDGTIITPSEIFGRIMEVYS